MATATKIPLASVTLSGTTSSVIFSGISQSYTDLTLVINVASEGTYFPYIQFNSDTGNNYSFTELLGNGTSASSSRLSNYNLIQTYNVNTTTAVDTTVTWNVMNYSNTTTYKTTLSRANNAGNGTNSIAALWRSTSAINSIFVGIIASGVTRNYTTGSTFNLYGIL